MTISNGAGVTENSDAVAAGLKEKDKQLQLLHAQQVGLGTNTAEKDPWCEQPVPARNVLVQSCGQ